MDLDVRDLGRQPYGETLELQRGLQREVIEARGATDPDERTLHLLLVEHDPPVITVSRRKSARGNLVASESQLRAAGVEVAETDRGGDITYHGPGQLVAYPIFDLNALRLRLHAYMRFLEDVVIRTIARYGVDGRRDETATGVWVGGSGRPLGVGAVPIDREPRGPAVPAVPRPAERKICAMGVRVSKWVSMHGLALNVTTNLEHFKLIVPCGLTGRGVTSLKEELGPACPTMEEVKRALIEEFRAAIQRQLEKSEAATTAEE